MPSKKSSSKSTTQTTTDQSIEDNRVVVSDEGVGIGKLELVDSSYSYVQEFSPHVAEAFAGLIELSASAGEVAMGSVEQSIKATERTSAEFMRGLTDIQTGTAALTRLIPYALIGIGGLVLIMIFGQKR